MIWTIHVGVFVTFVVGNELIAAAVSMGFMARKWYKHGFRGKTIWSVMWADLGKLEFLLRMCGCNALLALFWIPILLMKIAPISIKW